MDEETDEWVQWGDWGNCCHISSAQTNRCSLIYSFIFTHHGWQMHALLIRFQIRIPFRIHSLEGSRLPHNDYLPRGCNCTLPALKDTLHPSAAYYTPLSSWKEESEESQSESSWATPPLNSAKWKMFSPFFVFVFFLSQRENYKQLLLLLPLTPHSGRRIVRTAAKYYALKRNGSVNKIIKNK